MDLAEIAAYGDAIAEYYDEHNAIVKVAPTVEVLAAWLRNRIRFGAFKTAHVALGPTVCW